MKSILISIAVLSVSIPMILFAGEIAPVAIPEVAPDPKELLSAAGDAVNAWHSLGWLAGSIALINVLMNTLRLGSVGLWFAELGIKWLKPLIACALGALLGGLSTMETGAPIWLSIAAGAIAGLGSSGFHELVSGLRKRK